MEEKVSMLLGMGFDEVSIFVIIVIAFSVAIALSALTLLVEWQEGHPACK